MLRVSPGKLKAVLGARRRRSRTAVLRWNQACGSPGHLEATLPQRTHSLPQMVKRSQA